MFGGSILKPHWEGVGGGGEGQCPKLRVHPAPGVHISTAGCTIFGSVHPVCARFLSQLYKEGACRNFRVHSFRKGAPCGCTK